MLNPLNIFYEALGLSLDAIKIVGEWNREAEVATSISPTAEQVVRILLQVPNITIAHSRDFKTAQPIFTLKKDGTVVKIYMHPVGVKHVFLADSNNKMIFGGYVDFWHFQDKKFLDEAIEKIRREFS